MTDKKFEIKSYKPLWIMLKYDVLPWVIGAGLFTLFVSGVKESTSNIQNANDLNFEKIFKIEKQR